jgi:hypothetical protein
VPANSCCDSPFQLFEASNSVEVLVELLQIYRDAPDIFQRAAGILGEFAAHYAKYIAVRFPNEVVRMRNLLVLMERREVVSAQQGQGQPAQQPDLSALRLLVSRLQ